MIAKVLGIVGFLTITGHAHAQGLQVVGRLDGFACMSLNVTDKQAMDPSFVVPLRTEPSASSPAMGRAAATVYVRSPIVERNGYVAAILYDGRPGWIAASAISKWHSPGGPAHECIPSRMSNGLIGSTVR